MENYDYKQVSEVLIDFHLQDWKEVLINGRHDQIETNYQKRRILRRLASLVKYEDLPINFILEVAAKRNETFSFLNQPIDIEHLEIEINKTLEDLS